MDRAWVTCASTKEEAIKATLLAKSINRSFSRIKTLALISQTIPKNARENMEKEFDLVLTLPTDSTITLTKNEFVVQALLHCYNLKFLRSFVYLECNCLVIQNSDDILDSTLLRPPNIVVRDWLLNKNEDSIVMFKSSTTLSHKQQFLNRDELDINATNWLPCLIRFQDLHQLNDLRSTFIVLLPPHFESFRESNTSYQERTSTSAQSEVMNLWKNLTLPTIQEILPQPCNLPQPDLKDSIAIIGMSLRFPGGCSTPSSFWNLLDSGQSGIIPLPPNRWTQKFCSARNTPSKFRKIESGFLSLPYCPLSSFDGKFFNLSPKEVSYMDPQQRLTLELVYEALEHACIPPSSLQGSHTGIYGGWWRNDYREILQDSTESQSKQFLRTYMGNTLANLTSRVAHTLGVTGPCLSTESGCSTSMVAVDCAVRALLQNECKAALALGVNLFLHAFNQDEFPGEMVAQDGRCKTFDSTADGFGRAEGCGVLVLKRYTDAHKDKDRIFGLIRGSAVVQEGLSCSIGTPTVDGEALAMTLALQRARVDPEDVEYLEAHGTGTPTGDPLEMAAIAKAYGKAGRKKPLVVGSVKTNIGHTESAAGIAGIIKTLLVLEKECIPKHLNFESLNPNVQLADVPAILPLEKIPWKRIISNGKPRIAGVSSFGITGTNAHVIIQEPPPPLDPTHGNFHDHNMAKIPLHFLKLSASCNEALEDLKSSYKDFLELESSGSIEDITYSANTGRDDLPIRTFAVGSSKSQILSSLLHCSKVPNNKPTKPSKGKLCFLFTGQGSQYLGMSKSLYDLHPIFQQSMDLCFQFLESSFGLSNLKEILWGSQPGDLLNQTKYCQPLIFSVEYSLLQLWESWGITPDCVLGHSLGEFAAAVAAKILTVQEALTLVGTRSVLIHEKIPLGKMLVIKGSQKFVTDLVEKLPQVHKECLDIAAINSSDQTVVAGTEEAISALKELCVNNKIKSHVLQSSHAFHSRMMDPILEEYLTEAAEKVNHRSPTCTYVSGMEGSIMESLCPRYWKDHTSKWVNFLEASSTVLNQVGCDVFLEIGPQPILSSFIMENNNMKSSNVITCIPSMRKSSENEWTTLYTALGNLFQANVPIDWRGFHYFSPGNKITLPYYPFQRKSYPFPENPTNDWNPLFHPLVGSSISNSSETKIFERSIRLEESTSLFLKDHAVGPLLLFPGAGFLEMGIVGGFAATQCLEGSFQFPQYPICFEDFQIVRPLALDERHPNKLQTIVLEKDGLTQVTISSRTTLDDDSKKWITHARGSFLPFENLDQDDFKAFQDIELSQVLQDCNQEASLGNIYSVLAEEGFKFGKTFQTIQKVWKSSSSPDEALAFIRVPTTDTSSHLLHPVIIDAMFQASMFAFCPENEPPKLSVPVSVKKFVWYKHLSTPECYIHIRKLSSNSSHLLCLILYDSNGSKLAAMIDPTLLETSIPSILKSIELQKNDLPSMFEDVWRSSPASDLSSSRIPQGLLSFPPGVNYSELWTTFNVLEGPDKEFYDAANYLYFLQLIASLKEVGFNYDNDSSRRPFTLGDILSEFNIKSNLSKFIFYILLELKNEGFLNCPDSAEAINHNSSFTFLKSLPSLEQIHQGISTLLSQQVISSSTEASDVTALGSNLSKIFQGSESTLSLLFPESSKGGSSDSDSSPGPAESFYYNSEVYKITRGLIKTSIPVLFDQSKTYVANLLTSKPIIRILEVGAGTGTVTTDVFTTIPLDPSHIEYTYTDISSIFQFHGEKIFQDSGAKVIFKTLNIEEDPLSQGFMPYHYDLIIAGSVIHATKDIRGTLTNLHKLLCPQGTVFILELCRPSRAINILFGTLDGYSSYTDTDIRPFHCELEASKWPSVLEQSGYSNVQLFPTYNNHLAIIVAQKKDPPSLLELPLMKPLKSWIAFTRNNLEAKTLNSSLQSLNRSLFCISFKKSHSLESLDSILHQRIFSSSDTSLEGILFLWGCTNDPTEEFEFSVVTQSFLHLCKLLSKYSVSKLNSRLLKLIVITSNLQPVSLDNSALSSPFPSVLIGMTKVLQNENLHLQCKSLDLSSSLSNSSSDLTSILITEMFSDDKEFEIAYTSESSKVVKRLSHIKPSTLNSNQKLLIPKSQRFHLVLPPSKAIEDLRFAPSSAPTSMSSLEDNQVEIRVVAYSLNFRDVLVVLKPSEYFESLSSIGYDYSGVITRLGPRTSSKFAVGDPVIGINTNEGSLESHVTSKDNFLIPLCPSMTFAEGATLPAVTATVYACLVKAAKLQPSDTILIHTGSGGVGLTAIAYARHLGCRIIATAGNERKRCYLRRLGVQFVYNSRDTSYAQAIQRDVPGGGVDVVLNSLTSPGFKEASLQACKGGARFIEMSKLNVWSSEDVQRLRPDVHYVLVDVSNPSNEEIVEFMSAIEQFVVQDIIKPLPYVRFEAEDIRSALVYMQKAKHIGKIICAMPEPSDVVNNTAWTSKYFNDRSSYLITGGLGGIGMEIAKWMVKNGAGNVILTGRNPPNASTQKEINQINADPSNGNVFGSKVVTFIPCDIGNLEQCIHLLDTIKSSGFPQLRGIMHAAGVLSDASYENQSWEKFQETFHPKVTGGWNLHNLTLHYPLEHFIMFSSVSASLGSPGQSNHCAANTFLDSLAFHRHSLGLPSATMNWGQWGQVGVAANKDVIGIKPMTTYQCLLAFEASLRGHKLQSLICEVDFDLFRSYFSYFQKYTEEIKISPKNSRDSFNSNNSKVCLDGSAFWKEYDASSTPNERHSVITKTLKIIIREVLRLPQEEAIDGEAKLQEMGMDSLMMIEMKNMIQTLLGEREQIPNAAVKDCKSINELSSKLLEILNGTGQANNDDLNKPPGVEPEEKPLSREELNLILREDSKLPQELQVVHPSTLPACLPSQIQTVLITGCTGNLGPYVLRELCLRPHITKIYCLIRPHSKLTPEERLFTVIQSKNLSSDIPFSLLECLEGDVSKDLLGIQPPSLYEHLAGTVDAIINLSVRAAIQERYRKSSNSNCSRSVNVLGTIYGLKFASHKKLKHFYHASTLMTAIAVDSSNFLREDFHEPDEFDGFPDNAYILSKFVSDNLVAEGIRTGIPAKIFRFPFLCGESIDRGNTDLVGNHLVIRSIAYMVLGKMPPTPVPFTILPVSQASSIASSIFFNDCAGYEMYNVANPLANDELELPETFRESFGYSVDITEEVEDFLEFVDNLSRDKSSLDILDVIKKTTTRGDLFDSLKESPPPVILSWLRNKNVYWSNKLEKLVPNYPHCFVPSIELLKRDLECAKRTGIFARAGLH